MSEEHNELEERPADTQLNTRLKENGLDPDYWLKELKQFGIENIPALQYIQIDECSSLENRTRYPWEIRALQKLFNIQDSSVKIAEVQEKQTQILKERNEQASKLLQELKVFNSEKKSYQDEDVSRKVEEMQKLLEIPTESSVPPDKTLGDLVDYFEEQHSLQVEASLKIDHFTDEEVIRNSSGGLALEGIFHTENIKDYFKKREALLCVPEDFHLLGPEQGSYLSEKEFTSHEEENSFKKTMEKVGLSFSSSVAVGFNGLDLSVNNDNSISSASEISTNSSKDQTYICITKYNYVPLASYYFKKNQLRLTEDALSELKEIEKLIFLNSDAQILKNKCEDFFQRFGSHANLGPIHFGGIFWWKASMEGFHNNEIHEAKKSTGKALNCIMNCSYFGAAADIAHTQDSAENSEIKQFEKQIQVSVTKTGGPLKADSLPHWKAGLLTSNKSWSVIDRGIQFTSIWKIIVANYKNEFKDVIKLSSCLMNSYKALTGLNAEVMDSDWLIIVSDEIQLLLEGVKFWDPVDAKKHFNVLLDFKQKINELTKSHATWVKVCLSDKSLQTFFVKVAEKYKSDFSHDADVIKTQTQELIEPHSYSTKDFPDASVLLKWIYDSEKDKLDSIEIHEFTELSNVLQKSVDDILHITADLKSSKEEVLQTKRRATLNISLSLNSFLRIMKEKEQTDAELLILCISNNSGYCVENHNFQTLLSYKKIEFLKDQLHEAYEEYTNLRKQCAQRAQAFVLYSGLTSMGQYKEISSQQKGELLNFMTTHLGNSLYPAVDNILNQNAGNWEVVEDNLRAFSNGCELQEEVPAKEFIRQLSHLCQEEPPSTESYDVVDVSNSKGEFLMFLKDLDLEKYYPQKMNTADFHMISKATLFKAQPLENKDLPINFLQKLLVLDYGARYVHCEDKSNESQSNTSTINDDNKIGSSGNRVQNFFGRNKKNIEKQNANQCQRIHPMDVHMAIFHCADDFMRQYIYTKLSICQFALPLLIPNPNTRSIEFPLWAFHEVKKKWKVKHGDAIEESKSNDRFMKDTKTPIVSFIRLGPLAFSKSQTINWLMSKHRHDIFYHRQCEGSTKHSILMDGVTEIAWYCPGGREDDAFDDCTAFINLHGDARDHGQQLEFIQEISSVLVIVLTGSDAEDSKSVKIIDQLLESTMPCAFIIVDEEESDSETSHKIKIGIKGKNEAEMIREVRTKIQELLLLQNEVYSLNKCAVHARRHGFIVDEDKAQCKVGKEQGRKLLRLLKTEKSLAMKNKFLPLHGDLWREWCRKDKELNRLGGKSRLSIEQQRSDIASKKEALRKQQLKRSYPLNNFMIDFLQFLHSNEQGSKMYFLQWFKMYLDEFSSEVLSGLNQRYHRLWSSVKTEKQGGKNKLIIEKMEKKLQALSNQINLSAFGLEHVLRELGQMYEALEANIQDQSISNLPKIAANLMIWGYPIELMDGDAAHVPLKWITAVLDELKKALGDKKLFVLSVLGIQSTGKSTLLNAMFGLQFAVGAGRCTRGAFMQLVKVEEELQNEMTYDYVLVIDTEGLRSVELSNQNTFNHDNELATFVIGLGNLTLINIFGENPSEMQDILQIAIQAFLRMKKINLHPSCLFVHQNVGEITAKEKNMEARRCLQRKLDEMTLCAAKQEESDATCFNDVIKFDVDIHIHYFAHLWEGDPPMAPPNPRYSQNVQTLRKIILDSGKEKDTILSISAFSARVTDLWNALLNENFVFSFKNSVEIAAYNQLEVKYSQWAWKLRERMLTLQNEINIQIRKEEIKSFDITKFHKLLDEVYSTVQDDITVFFNEATEKNVLVQWRANTENRIANLRKELIQEMKKNANELIEFKEKNRKIDGMKAKSEDDILAKSKDLALSLKGKNLNEKDLEAKFTTLWNLWISNIMGDMPPPDFPEIHKDLDEILQERFNNEANIINTINESYKWKNLVKEFSQFLAITCKSKTLSENKKTKIKDSMQVLNKRIDEYIDKKEMEKMDYQSIYFHELLKIVQEEVNTQFDKKFKLLKHYILYASLFLCRNAARRFEKLSNAYRKANNPVIYLESKRAEFYKSFKVSCEGKLEVASLGDIISNKLKLSFKQAVFEKSAIDLSTGIKRDHPAFNGNRSKLELYLLKYLAEKENFPNYFTYFTDPKSEVDNMIKECVDEYMRDTGKISGFLHNNVNEFKNIIINAINQSTLKIKKEKGSVASWLDAFCSELGNKLDLSRDDLKSVKYQNITEIDFLKEAMTQAMDTVIQMLQEELSTCDTAGVKEKIIKILIEDFPGCWEQCPFCGAVCTNTGTQHGTDHSVQFHRPTGLKGRTSWWFGKHLRTDICTSLVVSIHSGFLTKDKRHGVLYKRYRDAGPPYSNWSITPDNSSLSYWKWVTCRFQSDIEKWRKKSFLNIPAQWRKISKEDAISEIENYLKS